LDFADKNTGYFDDFRYKIVVFWRTFLKIGRATNCKAVVEMVNFHYVGGDGCLKALNFVIQDHDHLENILSTGEREACQDNNLRTGISHNREETMKLVRRFLHCG